MPELPDVTVYVEALRSKLAGRVVAGFRILNPFVLRSVDPPPSAWLGRPVRDVRRLGKRIVLDDGEDLYLVIHLMIAGRLRWLAPGKQPPGRITLAVVDFGNGALVLTEAGKKRRASVHVVRGAEVMAEFDRGGLEPLEASAAEFTARLRLENHTLKRALTDPRLFSGIGNAYSDEILHRARLSPLTLTTRLDDADAERLWHAARDTLVQWTDTIRREASGEFPEKVTAFREGMAVHGRYGKPCPDCGTAVQRIRYAENETNYCARCQTGGILLRDRALSRLLREDWPRSIDDW